MSAKNDMDTMFDLVADYLKTRTAADHKKAIDKYHEILSSLTQERSMEQIMLQSLYLLIKE